MRQRIWVQQLVISIPCHRLEFAFPVFAGFVSFANDDLPIFCFELNLVAEAALLKQEPGDSNPLRVADLNDSGFHGIQSNYRDYKTQQFFGV